MFCVNNVELPAVAAWFQMTFMALVHRTYVDRLSSAKGTVKVLLRTEYLVNDPLDNLSEAQTPRSCS